MTWWIPRVPTIIVCWLALLLAFYRKVFWRDVSTYECVVVAVLVGVCTVASCFVSSRAGHGGVCIGEQ